MLVASGVPDSVKLQPFRSTADLNRAGWSAGRSTGSVKRILPLSWLSLLWVESGHGRNGSKAVITSRP